MGYNQQMPMHVARIERECVGHNEGERTMGFTTRLRAMMQREISAADVDGLLRGSGQLEDLRRQIAARREAGEIAHPGRPWETYEEIHLALLFFWAAQGYIAIARGLKEADDASDPGTADYMPRVSHDQAIALLRQAGDYLAIAHAAMVDPAHDPGRTLPIPLGPRVEAAGRCPVSHLKGMLDATEYLDGYAQVEVDTYANAAGTPAPEAVRAAASRLQGELAAARSRLAMAKGRVLPILGGASVDEGTHEGAEDDLWSALEGYIWFGQAVAMPSLLGEHAGGSAAPAAPSPRGHRPPPPAVSQGRAIARTERWLLTSGVARERLRGEGRTDWGEDELNELWENKNWHLSAEEARFLAETAELERQGAIRAESYMAECPFDPVWATTSPVIILNQHLGLGSQFAYDHHHGRGHLLTNFQPVPDFQECSEDKHDD